MANEHDGYATIHWSDKDGILRATEEPVSDLNKRYLDVAFTGRPAQCNVRRQLKAIAQFIRLGLISFGCSRRTTELALPWRGFSILRRGWTKKKQTNISISSIWVSFGSTACHNSVETKPRT